MFGDEALERFDHAFRAFARRGGEGRFEQLVLGDGIDDLLALLLQFNQEIAQARLAQRLDCLENGLGRGLGGLVRVQRIDDVARQRLQRRAACGLSDPGFVALGQRFIQPRQPRSHG